MSTRSNIVLKNNVRKNYGCMNGCGVTDVNADGNCKYCSSEVVELDYEDYQTAMEYAERHGL